MKTDGLKAVGPTAVACFTADQILDGFQVVDHSQYDIFVHVGANLPVSHLISSIEAGFGKPIIGVNVATQLHELPFRIL